MAGRQKGLPKTGGRQKGSKNKRTIALEKSVEDIMRAKNYDPIQAMIELAQGAKVSVETKFAVAKELAQYRYPRKGNDGGGSLEGLKRVVIDFDLPGEQ